jgi:hypothetical protein
VSNNPISGRIFQGNKIQNNDFQNSLEFHFDNYVKAIKDFWKNLESKKEIAKLQHVKIMLFYSIKINSVRNF